MISFLSHSLLFPSFSLLGPYLGAQENLMLVLTTETKRFGPKLMELFGQSNGFITPLFSEGNKDWPFPVPYLSRKLPNRVIVFMFSLKVEL